MSKEIFISHAVKDKDLADAFVDLMVTAMGISADDIFCSSLEGTRSPPPVNKASWPLLSVHPSALQTLPPHLLYTSDSPLSDNHGSYCAVNKGSLQRGSKTS